MFDNGENFWGSKILGILKKPQGFSRILNGINEKLFDNEKIVWQSKLFFFQVVRTLMINNSFNGLLQKTIFSKLWRIDND